MMSSTTTGGESKEVQVKYSKKRTVRNWLLYKEGSKIKAGKSGRKKFNEQKQ